MKTTYNVLKLQLEKETRNLEQSEDKFIRIISNDPDGVLIVDADTGGHRIVRFMNPAAENLLGQSCDELLGKPLQFSFPIKVDEPTEVEIETPRETGGPINVTVEIRAVEIDWKGRPTWLISLRDIPPWRKKLLKAFLEEKEWLDVTLRSLADGVIAADKKGIVRIINWVAGQMTGWGQEEAVGKPLADVLKLNNKTTPEAMIDLGQKVIKKGECINSTDTEDWVLAAREGNGSEIPIEYSCAPIFKDEEVMGTVWVIRDVTEKKEMEEEAIRVQNLEALGVLAAGIAHQYNNILTSTLGYISLAQKAAKGDKKLLNRLNKVEQAGLRVKEISARLLTFSKGGEPRKEKGSIVNTLELAAKAVLKYSHINTKWSIANDLYLALFDPDQVGIALKNILKNAVEAMPNGGEIEIKGENIEIPDFKFISIKPGSYVKISIMDQGTGIAQEYQSKVFSPYFSTREDAEGMGLTTAYSIVLRHGGWIRFKSTEGKGSLVTFLLPASVSKTVDRKPKIKPGTSRTRTLSIEPSAAIKGKVLVMDDEEFIRDVAGDLLQTLNYDIEFAETGEEAIRLYREAIEVGELFHAVILDLVVPNGMGGKECIRELREIDPNVKAIVSSGYSNDPVMANYRDFGFQGVLPKPYQLQKLSEALEKLQ
ncbi:MAG: PAS domain S-box protein [Candidatus Aminicenantes bacterium]|nr:PAS domain S-box protein [Candidatus Aminicenantes bacterium]NIM80863.1 PAS domain S-box protein [Candidatus Aminicenantes bacterium]NIN20247.1 PAS domain S-box protein [Candidatus Aminicenantes bacterium]NIN44026.1 PAS domain S-box protein [Candidatus Aminicenantes bacterium]NIN86836.1 PAS domain S-box protein [Candidatus Aminicenantes bacterium]